MLVVMVGLPGSGKSTYAEANFRCIVSPDRIRSEVFGTDFDRGIERAVWRRAYAEVRERLAGGAVVCFDATSVTRRRRRRLLALAHELGVPSVAVWIRTPALVAWQRNRARTRMVPRGAFEQIRHALESPTTDEGFVAVVRIPHEPREAVEG